MQREKPASKPKPKAKDPSDISKARHNPIIDTDYPPPMDPMYVNRALIHPWRRKGGVLPGSKETPSAVMWTHMEQNMFELQVAAAEHGTHPQKELHEDPYPQ